MAVAAPRSRLETMELLRKEAGKIFVTGICGTAGVAAALAIGACGAETGAAPEEAIESPPAADARDESAESSPGTVEYPPCGGEPSAGLPGWRNAAHHPLVIIDGVRCDPMPDPSTILTLDIVSFEIVKGSDAVAEYGEEGSNGAVIIFTWEPGDGGNSDSAAGEPPR